MKDIVLGLLIGGIIGLWTGVNLGKDQPLMTNPFANKSTVIDFNKKIDELQHSVSQKSKALYEDSKKAVNEAL